jgi:hypothetical protein
MVAVNSRIGDMAKQLCAVLQIHAHKPQHSRQVAIAIAVTLRLFALVSPLGSHTITNRIFPYTYSVPFSGLVIYISRKFFSEFAETSLSLYAKNLTKERTPARLGRAILGP